MSQNFKHESVLLDEVINFLDVRPGRIYLDATLGGGGHSRGILELGGKVVGLEGDPDALRIAKKNIGSNPNFTAVLGNFREIDSLTRKRGYYLFDGILFDLGLSTFQLKIPGRGFSFLRDEVLDMRMSPKSPFTAKDLIRDFSREELYEIFIRFGEERFSSRLADAIVRRRSITPIVTTGELFDIIRSITGQAAESRKVAQRVFQALRIYINDEVGNLTTALPRALGILNTQGRLMVIAYHSIEDRVVKTFFNKWEGEGLIKVLTKRPIRPSREEILKNKSSRSAKLRALERIYEEEKKE